ncbi:hypothetical protein F4778DRAFT_781487 [Xylariomycetidae sp. FL2044]|nr:hypothetical protein F4778DRAFT_781487 [Xylariomycetidae sp. FL2044]
MLFPIGRFAATTRNITTAVATSSRKIVVSRLASPIRGRPAVGPKFGFVFARAYAQRATKGNATKGKATAKPKSKPKSKSTPQLKATKKTKSEATPVIPERLQKGHLKSTALYTSEPSSGPTTAWTLYVQEHNKSSGVGPGEGLASHMKTLGEEFKNLSTSQAERLESNAQQNKIAHAGAYKAWVESFSVGEILQANKARKQLKKKYNYPRARGRPSLIRDDRQPKKPATPYALYTKARWASGEHTGPVAEVTRAIAKTWNTLSQSEKQPYADLAKAEVEHYHKQLESLQPGTHKTR